MGDQDKRLFLLDGMALVYRAHFAMSRNPITSSSGMNTSATLVFANTLLDILNKQDPTHIGVVFDTPEPTHRDKLYPEYKAQREAMPEDLSRSMPYIFRLCEAFNLPILHVPGWEADDVIGTLAERSAPEGFTTYMVTPDKDFGQLVSDRTLICKPARAGGGMEVLGVREVLDRWKIERVEQVTDIFGLMGDSSDNVPGVPGIGEKTAQKLIGQFGSLENLLNHVSELKGKQRENLETYRDQALLSKELVTIDRNVPLKIGLSDLQRREWDSERLMEILRELEFNVLGKRLFGDAFQAGPKGPPPEPGEATGGTVPSREVKTIREVPHSYCLVDTPDERRGLIQKLSLQPLFCFDTETTGLDSKTCGLIGMAFSFEAHSGTYVPLPEDRDEVVSILEEFRPVFENPSIEKVGHNLKFDLSVFSWHGIRVRGRLFDTMLAAHLAAPDLRRTLDYLAEALLSYRPISISDLIGEKGEDQLSLRELPIEKVVDYAAEDADITFQLSRILRPMLSEKNQERVFNEVESPLIPVLVNMEFEGIRMDVEVLQNLSGELRAEIDQTAERIFELAGERFNLNSSQQLGHIFFDKLKLDPAARRTQKTKQYQTNELALTRLAQNHEIVQKVLYYRLCTKLKSTYLDMLPGTIFPKTGRVHTHYEQAVTATGRMQSHGPNLQTIPVRSEQGREIRKAFVPRNDAFTLLSADYSQIELRIAAELSGDEGMLETFRSGGDIHTATAMKIYGLDEEEVTADMRRKSKTVNFGIIYGISPFGLSERLDIPRPQAAELIAQYFMQYPGARNYMDETIAFARENGFVETITGRRRYLRDIDSRNAATRKAAERNAINAPIQGSAADMIKIAMVTIHRELNEKKFKTKMLLQVHDELVFDLHKDESEAIPPIVEKAMKHAIPMKVPIVVEMGVGDNWLGAH